MIGHRAKQSSLWAWGCVALIVALAAAIRVRLLEFPLERDEGEYAYAAQLILQGVPPYELVYNMKLPGTYAAYALIMAVFGQTIAGIHLGLVVVNAATIVLVFLLARHLFDVWAGVVAGASFAVLSLSPSVLGQAAHATHFVALFAVAGLLLLLRATEPGRMSGIGASGLLLGLAFVMKQPAVFFPLFGALYLAWHELRMRPIVWSRSAARLGAFAAGAIAPLALTCMLLLAAGVFDKFWFWTITYAREYVSQVPISAAVDVFVAGFKLAVGSSGWLWGLAVVGLIGVFEQREWRRRATFTLGLLVFSFLAVCPGFYFRNHYFIVMLPAVAVLNGAAIGFLGHFLAGTSMRVVWQRAIPAALFIIVLGYPVWRQRDVLLQMNPVAAARKVYGANPFPESVEIAEYLRRHSSADARIAVLGSEPQIFFYSGLRSATGYIYTYGLMERHKHSLAMQQEMISEIEAARPEYLVGVNVSTSWLVRPDSEKLILDWYKRYSEEHYELVGLVDILSEERTEYRWDDQVKGYSVRSPSFILVHRRKTS